MLTCLNSYKLFLSAIVNAKGYKVSANSYGIVAARVERGRFNKFSIF
jgi:hypothetical protein